MKSVFWTNKNTLDKFRELQKENEVFGQTLREKQPKQVFSNNQSAAEHKFATTIESHTFDHLQTRKGAEHLRSNTEPFDHSRPFLLSDNVNIHRSLDWPALGAKKDDEEDELLFNMSIME